jgi:hypothetical protein
VRLLAAFVGLLCPAFIGVSVSGLVVPIRAIMPMPVLLLAPAVLVVPERHALAGHNGGHALDRYSYRQNRYSKKSNVGPKHPLPL